MIDDANKRIICRWFWEISNQTLLSRGVCVTVHTFAMVPHTASHSIDEPETKSVTRDTTLTAMDNRSRSKYSTTPFHNTQPNLAPFFPLPLSSLSLTSLFSSRRRTRESAVRELSPHFAHVLYTLSALICEMHAHLLSTSANKKTAGFFDW